MSEELHTHHSHSHHHHHSHGEAKNKFKDPRFYKRIAIICVFAFAVIALVPYIAHKLLPFMRSIAYYHKVNVSTLSYIALRICLMALPLIIAVPAPLYNKFVDKIELIKRCLELTAFFYFLGMVADIITYNVIGGYVDDGSDPIMLKLLWNDTTSVGIFFCFVEGVLYFITSKMVKGHKRNVAFMFFLTFAVGALMPLLHDYFTGNMFTEAWNTWFSKNVYFYISQAILLIGVIISATSRWLWSSAFWH